MILRGDLMLWKSGLGMDNVVRKLFYMHCVVAEWLFVASCGYWFRLVLFYLLFHLVLYCWRFRLKRWWYMDHGGSGACDFVVAYSNFEKRWLISNLEDGLVPPPTVA